jgi:hypothetical protein
VLDLRRRISNIVWAVADECSAKLLSGTAKLGECMDSTVRPVMPNPEEYREYAKLCDELASTAKDSGPIADEHARLRQTMGPRAVTTEQKGPALPGLSHLSSDRFSGD